MRRIVLAAAALFCALFASEGVSTAQTPLPFEMRITRLEVLPSGGNAAGVRITMLVRAADPADGSYDIVIEREIVPVTGPRAFSYAGVGRIPAPAGPNDSTVELTFTESAAFPFTGGAVCYRISGRGFPGERCLPNPPVALRAPTAVPAPAGFRAAIEAIGGIDELPIRLDTSWLGLDVINARYVLEMRPAGGTAWASFFEQQSQVDERFGVAGWGRSGLPWPVGAGCFRVKAVVDGIHSPYSAEQCPDIGANAPGPVAAPFNLLALESETSPGTVMVSWNANLPAGGYRPLFQLDQSVRSGAGITWEHRVTIGPAAGSPASAGYQIFVDPGESCIRVRVGVGAVISPYAEKCFTARPAIPGAPVTPVPSGPSAPPLPPATGTGLAR